MDQVEQEFGKPNPKAPAALSRFAFLIGSWRCEARVISEELMVLGMNVRTYDATKQTWNIKWLNALAGTWVDLGPEELGGVTFDGHSEKHFTWRGEKSDDRKTWNEFMVAEVYRL